MFDDKKISAFNDRRFQERKRRSDLLNTLPKWAMWLWEDYLTHVSDRRVDYVVAFTVNERFIENNPRGRDPEHAALLLGIEASEENTYTFLSFRCVSHSGE